ncbi:Lrp/AsnC family transcriptional regulator, leucine-responsive regulatory protein [Saccharopolyspora shandongensis]|uniref:Lrp/AsnC family transcriptional regulator, leucine-responsive regulatory protein n=1 Tax=Saccharopolyspora shandongensis TaxID=418495 RepID=A0A1H2ZSN6_9PSEU|nr:Lrp/AsnC ligand binding domain-containing protein [Saccharopolyspora shandongensis]SDX20326.1 Lrp/AsnC family transcriptional regulator, leucine-responsive regulatory protein [Saccharopolyspora shandongensis]
MAGDGSIDRLTEIPEVLESHHVVGDDCWIFKVAVPDVGRLEEIPGSMNALPPRWSCPPR